MKSKLNKVVITILVILVLAMGAYLVYDKILNKVEQQPNQECPICQEQEKEENQENVSIPLNDRYQLAIDAIASNSNDYSLKVFLLNEDGYLYYKIFDSLKSNIEGIDYYYTYDFEKNEAKLNKYENVNNIKRIKSTNTISTGVAFNLLLITEEGLVYDLVYDSTSQKLTSYLNQDFKNYKVDDILTYEPVNGCIGEGGCPASYKIKLQDGNIINQ